MDGLHVLAGAATSCGDLLEDDSQPHITASMSPVLPPSSPPPDVDTLLDADTEITSTSTSDDCVIETRESDWDEASESENLVRQLLKKENTRLKLGHYLYKRKGLPCKKDGVIQPHFAFCCMVPHCKARINIVVGYVNAIYFIFFFNYSWRVCCEITLILMMC